MGRNNDLYRSFKMMLDGYKTGDVDGTIKFESGVISLNSLNPENPFEKGSEEYECFFRMHLYYKNSLDNGPGSKFSRKQIFSVARKLCELKPKNPYRFDKKEDEEEKAAQKAAKEAALKAEQERKEQALKDEAERIVKEEQRRKQAELRNKIAKAEAEAAKLAEEQRQIELAKKVEEERRKAASQHYKEEDELASLLKKNEEEKARLMAERHKTQAVEQEDIVKPQVILGVLPEKKKGFFARLFKR